MNYLTQEDKQDILRAVQDLDNRLTRTLNNMGYDSEGKRLQANQRVLEVESVLISKITADIEKELIGGI